MVQLGGSAAVSYLSIWIDSKLIVWDLSWYVSVIRYKFVHDNFAYVGLQASMLPSKQPLLVNTTILDIMALYIFTNLSHEKCDTIKIILRIG